MGTVISRMYSPESSDKTRDVLHPETQIDAVLDPVTGIPLREQLNNINDTLQPVNVNGDKPGLITPDMAKQFAQSAANLIVLDSIQPSFASGGYWFNIYDPTLSETDKE